MDDANIVVNIKKEVYNKALEFYNILKENKSNINKIIYTRVLDVQKRINNCVTLSDIESCLNDIQNELSDLKVSYDSKVLEYRDDKSKKHLLGEIKDITKIAQALTDIYSVSNVLISKSKVKGDSKVSKFKDRDDTEKKDTLLDKKLVNIDGIDFDNEYVRQISQLSDKIISLREELVDLDVSSKEAIIIRKEINDLCDKRSLILYELNGYDGINFIRNIESMEVKYSSTIDRFKSNYVEHDGEVFIKKLIEKIKIIADLKFFKTNSKYIEFEENASAHEKFAVFQKVYAEHLRDYTAFLSSVFGTVNPVIFKNGDYEIKSSDLLSYLGVYNLRGNYHDFKECHKSGKIGNEAISKELYADGLDRIEGFINSLVVLVREQIKLKGGKVGVSYNTESKESLKNQIDQNMYKLYREISARDKGIYI